MKKAIVYKGFDAEGNFVSAWTDEGRYTVRGAMAYLKERGWEPMPGMGEGRKLRRVWRKEDPRSGAAINAIIV